MPWPRPLTRRKRSCEVSNEVGPGTNCTTGTTDVVHPKPSGYRSFHLMYKYRPSTSTHAPWNGMRIEVQVRSLIQHWWATAVETVGLFTTQNLKGSLGDAHWLRFFVLMSSEAAQLESRPLVPGTPTRRSDRRQELRELVSELGAIEKLQAYGSALNQMEQYTREASSFLLLLDVQEQQLTISGFAKNQLNMAQQVYAQAEAENADRSGVDVVLVEADSIEALRRAYPNYFADTTSFVSMVRRAIR